MFRKLGTVGELVKHTPILRHGLNLWVNPEKTDLIRTAVQKVPNCKSILDLGGVWRVNAGYTRYASEVLKIPSCTLIDTDISEGLRKKISRDPSIHFVQRNFGDRQFVESLGQFDAVILFDVLIHQVDPDWDEILRLYASKTRCFIIFNQQICNRASSIRATDLPLGDYLDMFRQGPKRRKTVEFVYAHRDEIHPQHNKPYKDIHNIFQWGITDGDLRSTLKGLGFDEVFYKNYGKFSYCPDFENHGFVFVRSE